MAFHNLVDLEKLGYFLGKIKTLLNGKVDKESGKGLSTNDYTTDEKTKLGNIASGAQVNVIESVAVNGTALPVASKSVNVTVPTKLSDLTNDGNYVSDANYVHTDNNYTTVEKDKLAGIASGAQVNSITGVKGSAEESYRTGNVNITKGNIGLGNVEDKSSADIRGELTKKNVTDALGYTPPETDTTYSGMTEAEAEAGTATEAKLISAAVLDAAIENKGYTGNTGTITGITMNGASKGTSGVVDLGTVITAHQDISGKLDTSLKGAANGLAELDANGKVPSSQLPSYVDDIVEYNGQSAFPATGESGKIYLDTSTNKCYRWSGSAYVFIASDLALGTTSSTAFRGDYGASAYAHGVTNKGSAFASGLYKITTNSEGHVTAATAVEKSDITGLGIPGSDTTYSEATTSAAGLMSASDKSKLDGVDSGADVNVIEAVKVNGTALTVTNKAVDVTVPTKTSDLTNDSNFPVDASYVHTDNNYTTTEKNKLSGIEAEANKTVVDSSLSTTSENPVQNKVVKAALDVLDSELIVSDIQPTATTNQLWVAETLGSASSVATYAELQALQAEVNTKVTAISGKGLSSSDYTSEEKAKLLGIEAGATRNVVDSALSTSSTNPVQNKAVAIALNQLESEVIVSDTQPTATTNQVWINKTTGAGIEMATYAELLALADRVATLEAKVAALEGTS